MPRGKFLNHKGRSRQFTPVEELQREQELEGCLKLSAANKLDDSITSNDESIQASEHSFDISVNKDHEHVNGFTKHRKLGGAVEGLIEISNPNRPIKKSQKFALFSEEGRCKMFEDLSLDRRRRDRAREKSRSNLSPKTSSEATADLARLALVRKKREAAAEQRLAAKKENNSNYLETTPSTSKSDISMKKKSNNKFKSGGTVTNDFLKKASAEDQISKFVKGRNGNKRNVSMQA